MSPDSRTVYSIIATTSDPEETGLNASRWAAPALLLVANPGTVVSTDGGALLASPALAEAERSHDELMDPNDRGKCGYRLLNGGEMFKCCMGCRPFVYLSYAHRNQT